MIFDIFTYVFQAFPFAFALMSRKTQVAYEHLFKYIEENVFPLSKAKTFTTDFEIAMRNAIQTVNPSAKLFACYFHHNQAVKRKASQIDGLVDLIKKNRDVESLYYRLMVIPLLPADLNIDAFHQLELEANVGRNRAPIRTLFKYYKKQWIEKVKLIIICFLLY